MRDSWLVRVIVIALGLALGGWAAGNGVARSRLGDRFVTVKGISEREVTADLAIWLDDNFLPRDAFDWPLNVMVVRSGGTSSSSSSRT